MTKNQIIALASMIGITFIFTGIFVSTKLYSRSKLSRINSQVQQVDELITQNRLKEADSLIRYTLSSNPPKEVKEILFAQKDRIKDDLAHLREQQRKLSYKNKTVEEFNKREAARVAAVRAEQLREEKNNNLALIGGAGTGLFNSFAILFGACLFAGIGQLLTAFRDIAVNTYLATCSMTSIHRSIPPYRFIPFLSLVFYFFAVLNFIAGFGLLFYVIYNLV